MKDLKGQLADAFGLPPPEPPPPTGPDILSPTAHLDSPWLERLRALARADRSLTLAAVPKLGQARQLTDQLLPKLKRANRKREASELKRLRDDFYARRDKAAWAAVKQRFKAMGLSDKAYRALKQGGVDPIAALGRLVSADLQDLSGMGAKRLREYLTRP